MNAEQRITATRYIWTAFFFTVLVSNANVIFNGASLDVGNFVMTGAVGLVVMISTGFVWNWGDIPTISSSESAGEASQKAKRRARVEGMLDLLDDDELDDLRHRLQTRDEEVEMMLTDDGELRRRR